MEDRQIRNNIHITRVTGKEKKEAMEQKYVK